MATPSLRLRARGLLPGQLVGVANKTRRHLAQCRAQAASL